MSKNESANYKYLAVLDFEATCDDNNSTSGFDPKRQEIIELPVGLVSVESRSVVDQFNSFVRPVTQPQLTAFCSELTSIGQQDVAAADPITSVVENLLVWLKSHEAYEHNTLFVTCGDWDLLKMWPKQVSLVPDLQTPGYFKRWCNIKAIFREQTGQKSRGMMHMLKTMNIEHQGHHHRGADDVANLCRLAICLLENNATFRVTSSGG